MLTRLDLQRFRSIAEETSISLAPITLVYGPNSAGKSSIIKSLLFLKQSCLDAESSLLRYDGPFVDIGSPRAAVHRHRENDQFELGVHFSDTTTPFGDVSFGIRLAIPADGQSSSIRVTIHSARIGRHEMWFERSTTDPWVVRLRSAESGEAFLNLCRAASETGQSRLFDESVDPSAFRFRLESMFPARFVGHARGRGLATTPLSENDSIHARVWNAIGAEIAAQLRSEFQGISYLGPLRRPWDRVERIASDADGTSTGTRGEQSLTVLAKDPAVRRRVNDALRHLETGYELEVNEWTGPTSDVIGRIAPTMLVPSLRHLASDVSISPSDAGFGLSQLLPILIEAERRRRSLICIEQPELHLHPRMQARFGEVLARMVRGGQQNRFLIESHSEHLILRLQRLIRGGNVLGPDDVQILYVDNQEYDEATDVFHPTISSRVTPIRLARNGNFIDPWPGGFFGERWEELE